MLQVEGVLVLSRGQGREMSYAFSEGADIPEVLERFLVGGEVSREELLAALPAARSAGADSDRVLELVLLIETRLRSD